MGDAWEGFRGSGQAVPGNSIVLFTPDLSPIFLGITEKLSHLMELLGSLSVDLRRSKTASLPTSAQNLARSGR
jgi:hypothetical protein